MQKPTKRSVCSLTNNYCNCRIMNVQSPRVTHSNVPMVTVDSIAVEGWGAIAPPKYSVGIISIVILLNTL